VCNKRTSHFNIADSFAGTISDTCSVVTLVGGKGTCYDLRLNDSTQFPGRRQNRLCERPRRRRFDHFEAGCSPKDQKDECRGRAGGVPHHHLDKPLLHPCLAKGQRRRESSAFLLTEVFLRPAAPNTPASSGTSRDYRGTELRAAPGRPMYLKL
jgi:hypothetical protein